MARIRYIDKKFSPASQKIIAMANRICVEYQQQGYDLTLRQLYYQFVARGLIPNKQTEYKRLGSIINDARLAGQLDWDFIVDRTRNVRSVSHWDSPEDIVRSCAKQFAIDRWENQDIHVEVWIEKDALVGVIERVCQINDVSFFACRGYVSQSEIWGAANRLREKIEAGKRVLVLHLGDHDPSGIDMTRDIEDRLRMFIEGDIKSAHGIQVLDAVVEAYFEGDDSEEEWAIDLKLWSEEEHIDPDGSNWSDWPDSARQHTAKVWTDTLPKIDLEIRRIALTWDQVQQYNPPPNPAKLTDSRADGYIADYGYESWELDALDPATINDLIQNEIDDERDPDLWDEACDEQAEHRKKLKAVADDWDNLTDNL